MRSNPMDEKNALTVSPDMLRRLLVEKEREANRRLAEEFTARLAQVQFQEALAERMGRITDPGELAEVVVAALRDGLGAREVVLALVSESQFLEVVATTIPALAPYALELMEECFIAGETLSTTGEDAVSLQTLGTSLMPPGVPLMAVPLYRQDGKPLGVIYLEGALKPERLDWVPDVVSLAAQALEDCMHYAQIEQLVFDAVLSIALTNESRRADQEGHVRRVEQVAMLIARVLDLGPSEEKRIRMMALLHDMDPGAIADAFSAIRRGSETAQLWQALMADPFVGGIYPSPLANLQSVIDELRYLHARYDGKGNHPPVCGEGLPLATRIVAVAEAFDNLTGGRDHRTTLAIPMAIRQIKRYAGAMYDPRVVDALRWHYLPSQLEARVPSGGADDVF